jgi:YjbE family integral membrane protein
MDQFELTHELASLAQVVLIDITLAGDNAIVVGLAVAGLPDHQKRPAILVGIIGATVIRIALGAIALQLLAIIGLLLAGGLLLLWVCWKMFRELRHPPERHVPGGTRQKSLGQAMMQIILADVSMSLDNVLAVAGAAKGSTWVLMVGLLLSVVLMGVAANFLAKVLERQRWVAWGGLLIVFYVAVSMIWEGSMDVAEALKA